MRNVKIDVIIIIKCLFVLRAYTCTPICQELEIDVVQCYQNNPTQTLKCSSVVKEFGDCVRKHREVRHKVSFFLMLCQPADSFTRESI